MNPVPIDVQCYSGYRGDESPRRFLVDNAWIAIDEVLETWKQAGREPNEPQADHFKVRGSDGHDYLLRHDLIADQWLVENKW